MLKNTYRRRQKGTQKKKIIYKNSESERYTVSNVRNCNLSIFCVQLLYSYFIYEKKSSNIHWTKK